MSIPTSSLRRLNELTAQIVAEMDQARSAPAKSLFQLVGAGQVGRGSLYGMQALDRLAAHGFRVWPFDAPRMPVAVEIYPRVFMGSVTKVTRPNARDS